MLSLTEEYIATQVAFSDIIFHRGKRIYEHGSFMCAEENPDSGWFMYDVDGTHGDYTVRVELNETAAVCECNCPYPHNGCKHTVAVLLDIQDKFEGWKRRGGGAGPETGLMTTEACLSADEIKIQALEDRSKRARSEAMTAIQGEMYKGTHLVETRLGKQYQVTLHDPVNGHGHCTCPDFNTNRLGTCKHLLFLRDTFRKKRGFKAQVEKERFPFVDIYWDSVHGRPRLFSERPPSELEDLSDIFRDAFDENGLFKDWRPTAFLMFLNRLKGHKRVQVQETVLQQVDDMSMASELDEMAACHADIQPSLKTELYPYQKEGVSFALFRRAALIGDEMGLGKTLQAIALGLLKKEIFGFDKVLVVTLASLKEQWKREIERFTGERAIVVAGPQKKRKEIYMNGRGLFKITNYEAVLRDVSVIRRFKPDLLILDEAQRIKNFNTKTADAVKRLPRKHALVLTGTPLENKLEDVYSIIQFLDPHLLSPLWRFAADHFMLSRSQKGKILGYHNLELLHEKLKSVVIRRKKEAVLSDLPEEVVNNYYLDLTVEQADIHAGYAQLLIPILNKKYLTPMDLQRMMQLLLKMRQVCDSTYLIDRESNISPKLKELEGILDELVIQNGRKVVIFSEWTTMTYLMAKHLSKAGIPFVELTGKVPVKKRQILIDLKFP